MLKMKEMKRRVAILESFAFFPSLMHAFKMTWKSHSCRLNCELKSSQKKTMAKHFYTVDKKTKWLNLGKILPLLSLNRKTNLPSLPAFYNFIPPSTFLSLCCFFFISLCVCVCWLFILLYSAP